MTDLQALDHTWRLAFDDVSPLVSGLRTHFADRWVRFYSLPEGKRYADTEAEHGEILARHAAVLGQLFERGERLFVLSGFLLDRKAPVERPSCWNAVVPDAQPWRVVTIDDSPEDTVFSHVWASERSWQPGIFDELLRRVANWEIVDAAFLSARSGVCYHPYDGGADVIARDSAKREALAERFASWRSDLPSGL